MREGIVPVGCGFEHHRAGGDVGIRVADGAGPFEDATGVLHDGPGGGVFQGVVPTAEVREVVLAGGSAEGEVDGVVEVGAVRWLAAAGEAAV